MSNDASPFFIRPHRFDQPDQDGRAFPQLDRRRHVVLDPGEQALWRGRVEVAGYLLGPTLGDGVLHWSMPQLAEVTVTDRRLAFVRENWNLDELDVTGGVARSRHRRSPARHGSRVATGQIRWQWPSRLQLLPAVAGTDNRSGRPEQILLVCDSLRTIRQPGLALGGGDLVADGATRALTHVIRKAIARFRLANPRALELSPPERDMLSVRAGTGLFVDELADKQRGISLPGALVVEFVHRDDYYHRTTRSSPSAHRAPEVGTSEADLWRSDNPGSAS